jgi:hypothetical protein
MDLKCQARIITDDFIIEGTSETCYKTGECGAKAKKKVALEESEFVICTACNKRYKTKDSEKSIWLGWFDGNYPPTAHVQYSPWYYEIKENLKNSERELICKQIVDIEEWMRGVGKILYQEQPKKLRELIQLRAKLGKI